MLAIASGLGASARAENFTVASRLLPARYRRHLLALYGYARYVDDLGDEAAGDRLALLDEAEADLDRALAGRAAHPVFRAIGASAVELGLPIDQLKALIEANRQDQTTTRYATFDDLVGYCRLSANPVGRLVLAIFGVHDPEDARLSDLVCTALQIVEHLQDVREDAQRGRVYLPADEMIRFGCTDSELTRPPASEAVRAAVAFEAWRARKLLQDGSRLVGRLHGPARVAVAGFVGGGLAALDSIARIGFDPISSTAHTSKLAAAGHTARLLRGGSHAG